MPIVKTPGIISGRPRIQGTRIGVEHVVQQLRLSGSIKGVLKAYPHITKEQAIEALIYYAIHSEVQNES